MEIVSFRVNTTKDQIYRFLKKYKLKNKILEILANIISFNEIASLCLKYYPIYKAYGTCAENGKEVKIYFDSFKGELIFFDRIFKWTSGYKYLYTLESKDRRYIYSLIKKDYKLEEDVSDRIPILLQSKLIYEENGKLYPNVKVDPIVEDFDMLSSCDKVPTDIINVPLPKIQKTTYKDKHFKSFCYDLFNVAVYKTEIIYMPFWSCLVKPKNSKNFYKVYVSATTGQIIEEFTMYNEELESD